MFKVVGHVTNLTDGGVMTEIESALRLVNSNPDNDQVSIHIMS